MSKPTGDVDEKKD